MKQMIVSALVSLATGFFLVVGLGGGALVVGVIHEKLKEEPGKRHRVTPYFTPMNDNAIVESTVVRDVPHFTVRGTINNNETTDWDIPEIKVELLSKGVVLKACSDIVDWRILKPGQTTNFLVVCRDVPSPTSGESLEYRVRAFTPTNAKRVVAP
jgi:hypothetical protein